jgi:hypothetical protein
MDGSSTSDDPVNRDAMLYYDGHAYRLLASDSANAGCFQQLKLGSREICRGFLENIARDLAMRHRLWLEALRWAAYFGEGGVGHDFLAWLTEQVFIGRVGLYHVVCSGPPRGEPQPLDKKKVWAAISTAADNTPVVAPIKSALQMVTGADLGTDEAVSRWGEAAGIALGVIPGGKGIAKVLSKGLGTLGKKIEKQMEKRGWNTTDIENTLESPHRTVATKDVRYLPDGSRMADPATAYIRADGHYVVRNDVTKDIVQVSDRTNKVWKSPF